MGRATFRAALAVLALALPCCTEVTVHSGGQVETNHSFGVSQIKLDEVKQPILIRTHGAGVVEGIGHLTVGWLDEELVVFPDASECRLLVYVEHPQDLSRVMSMLTETGIPANRLCIAQGENHG